MPPSRPDRNRLTVLHYLAVGAAAAVFALGACTEKPVKLGFVGGLSQRVADLGISGRNGAILAVEARNRAGGVLGRPVKLVVKDDRQDAQAARQAVRELLDQGVTAIIGHMTSTMSTATLPLVNESKVVMMSPTATTDFLTGRDDYFFRVISSTKSHGKKMAVHLRKTVGLDAVAVVYDARNEAYTESWYLDFRREFEALGGTIALVETFYSGPQVHFFDLARRAIVPGADGLVIIAGAMDTAMLCQQVRKLNREIPMAAAEWASTEKLIDLGGAAVEGLVISQYFDRFSTDPAYLAFHAAYVERFGEEPGFASVSAYDAVNVVLDALEKQTRGQTLKEAILTISSFQGAQGKVMIDRYGDAVRDTFLTIVRNGEFRLLE